MTRLQTSTSSRKRKRKGTINPHCAPIEWQKTKINFIDTSGQGDFIVDTMTAIGGAADSALCVVSASDGVQVYTEKT